MTVVSRCSALPQSRSGAPRLPESLHVPDPKVAIGGPGTAAMTWTRALDRHAHTWYSCPTPRHSATRPKCEWTVRKATRGYRKIGDRVPSRLNAGCLHQGSRIDKGAAAELRREVAGRQGLAVAQVADAAGAGARRGTIRRPCRRAPGWYDTCVACRCTARGADTLRIRPWRAMCQKETDRSSE